jgi:hypothetical protein
MVFYLYPYMYFYGAGFVVSDAFLEWIYSLVNEFNLA